MTNGASILAHALRDTQLGKNRPNRARFWTPPPPIYTKHFQKPLPYVQGTGERLVLNDGIYPSQSLR